MTVSISLTRLGAAALLLSLAPAALAAAPREELTAAALATSDKTQALGLVSQAILQTQAQLVADPNNKEAQLQHAIAIGDRAKLTKSPGDAKEARRLFEAFAGTYPNDPEGQFAVAAWHLDTLAAGFIATTVLGARKDLGLAALDRAVALGRSRPSVTGYAALFRIRLNPADVATARQLAELAVSATPQTTLDRYGQHAAQAVLIPLRAGDGRAAANLARALLPFARVS